VVNPSQAVQKPTIGHCHGEFRLRFGHPLPYGARVVPGGVNFSIFSCHATDCTLVLFRRGEPAPFSEIPFPPEFRIGDVFAMTVLDLEPADLEYGYRMDGPNDPQAGHRFDKSRILLDPHALTVTGRETYGAAPDPKYIFPHRGHIPANGFEWEQNRPLKLRPEDLVIYEMHVRGFTRHASSGVVHPGTFDGLREKIPYLLEMGFNCVELMPVFEFEEMENPRTNPDTGEQLVNYWGYSTIGFKAPKASYAASGAKAGQVDEFKELVRDLHIAGIQVILDVVFNHTGEGGFDGPVISFRGIDNKTYYMLTPDGRNLNYTGCGNTLDCNHPIVRHFILECLRYWAAEYHIDGFRFDLASVLDRDPNGETLPNPPLLESMARDPVLSHCVLIAEAWDAGGLYQVGHFPSYGRWMEWNGKFRDTARRFLKGDSHCVSDMVQRILGSPDLYRASGRRPTASVNFLTCHDGFTLADLFAYNEKHNLSNGENNRDGNNDNMSWNCGAEGPIDDPSIKSLRLRCAKNALTLLLVSQGVPMILMGDEMGRTQLGNNNAYCHDTDWNWLNWDLARENAGLLRFVRSLIHFRRNTPALCRSDWLGNEISWHGVEPFQPDWSDSSHSLAFMLSWEEKSSPRSLYAAFNMHWEPLEFRLPNLPAGQSWHLLADTGRESPHDFHDPATAPLLENTNRLPLITRSCALCLGR